MVEVEDNIVFFITPESYFNDQINHIKGEHLHLVSRGRSVKGVFLKI